MSRRNPGRYAFDDVIAIGNPECQIIRPSDTPTSPPEVYNTDAYC